MLWWFVCYFLSRRKHEKFMRLILWCNKIMCNVLSEKKKRRKPPRYAIDKVMERRSMGIARQKRWKSLVRMTNDVRIIYEASFRDGKTNPPSQCVWFHESSCHHHNVLIKMFQHISSGLRAFASCTTIWNFFKSHEGWGIRHQHSVSKIEWKVIN